MKKGYSVIEVVLVMFLLITFGIAAFALVYIGGNSYERMTNEKNAEAELRIAVSYAETRLRKYDRTNGFRIDQTPDRTGNALVFNDFANGIDYETWVFWYDGKLIEIITEKDKKFNPDDGFEIAAVDSFDISFNSKRNEVVIKASITSNGKEKTLETIYSIKSGR